ncbi:hypothetical protein JKP88DRAFT_306780 [Tribonema minus]|uniref:Uncharacterized protein n=1 Tax=Tribonema minus TaxID=303371 RepID=A0A835Z5K2_9STRA|nr:hypothetical protein JKP88DRAFT_306780 [Tribonema minus]
MPALSQQGLQAARATASSPWRCQVPWRLGAGTHQQRAVPLGSPGDAGARNNDLPQLSTKTHKRSEVRQKAQAAQPLNAQYKTQVWQSAGQKEKGWLRTMATIASPARAWAQEGPELLSPEEQAEWRRYVVAAANIRSLAFQRRAQPGTLRPQARFTLLPVTALRPAFLQLSQDTIGTLVNKVVDAHIPVLKARVNEARPRRRADLAVVQPLFANVTGVAAWFDATLAQGAAADELTRNHYRHLDYYIGAGTQQREALKSALQQGQSNTAWWGGVFDFHTRRRRRRRERPRHRRRPDPKLRYRRRHGPKGQQRRKPLRPKGGKTAGGLPLLWGLGWTLAPPDGSGGGGARGQRPVWLVNHLMTDGLKVCVGLVAVIKPRQQEREEAGAEREGEDTEGEGEDTDDGTEHQVQVNCGRLPTGVAELRKRGYRSVQAEFDIKRDKRGVFNSVKKLPDKWLQALHDADETEGGAIPEKYAIKAIGVDPGQKSIAVSVRGLVTPSLSAADLKGTAVESRTADFKFEALAKNSQRYFERCNRRDPQFQAAEAQFTEQTSLRRPGVAVAANYAAVTYDTLSVRTRHYFTWERRMRSFNSYRARERAVARVARDIIGPRDTGVHRVVFFGKAEFGSGSRGPIPRKRLIRHLACLAAVVLTDEYRTSITCPQDRAPLHRLALGSRVFRCANARPGVPVEVRCNVGAIDRDHAGADNILMCGVAMLLGGVRPAAFRRGPDCGKAASQAHVWVNPHAG